MAQSVASEEFSALDFSSSHQSAHVLLAVADDDLCLWFWQDVTRAGVRPIIASSMTEAREKIAIEHNICLLITTASDMDGSKALFRAARARKIPYAIARICDQGIRLSHMNGNLFEGSPSAMGDVLSELVQSSLRGPAK